MIRDKFTFFSGMFMYTMMIFGMGIIAGTAGSYITARQWGNVGIGVGIAVLLCGSMIAEGIYAPVQRANGIIKDDKEA